MTITQDVLANPVSLPEIKGRSGVVFVTCIVAVAALVRFLLGAWLGNDVILLLLTLPVVLSARYKGPSAGGWATLLCLIIDICLFSPVENSLSIANPHDQLRILIFLLIGILMSYLVGGVRENELQLAAELRYRTLAEEQLRTTLDEVQKARRELEFQKFSVDQAAIVATVNKQGKLTDVNDKFCDISGYPRSELLGQDHHILSSHYHPRSFWEGLYKTIEGGKVWRAEIRNRKKNGEIFWVDTTIVPFVLTDGTIDRHVVIRHDITRLKEAEESLREADHKKDEFIATLAHELRNPLAPIKNAVAILRQEPSDQGVRNRLRDMIGRQVDQMTRLIEDLLDVSRIASGKVMLKTEVLDARKVIDQALDTSRPLIDRKQHILEVNVTPQPLLVKADPVRLTQIVANVINNAAKYTDDGGHIWITAKSEGGQVVISIRDNGIGLAPEMQQRVFDLFTQVDQTISRSSGGLGIGLTLVRKLTEQHGGSVAVRSRGLGLGSEFIVSLEEFKAGAVEVKACPDGTDKLQDYPC